MGSCPVTAMGSAKLQFRGLVGVHLGADFVAFAVVGRGVDGSVVHAAVLETVCYYDRVREMCYLCDGVVVKMR
jgi:hypothetical protein